MCSTLRCMCPQQTRNTMIFAREDSKRLIVTLGVENLVVVDTGDVLMICDQDHAQDVRAIVDELNEKGKTEYL